MEALANIFLAATELAESEGRTLRRAAFRFIFAICLIVLASIIGLAGVGFLLYGMFWLLAQAIGVGLAAGAFGLAALIIAGVITWLAKGLAL